MTDPLKVINKPWYSDGLRFACTECGRCCTGAPGYIWVTEAEIDQIARSLNLTPEEFGKRYLRKVMGRYSLLERPETYDCIFLSGKKCQIYSVRPKQCRTYPWWNANLKTPEDWKEEATHCEGINPDAPLISFEEIEKQRRM